mmetsp:Transcript_13109/g.29816  ORF Transcript_13109/g.29816 Transcript_13109/m.29816 type:complete len:770 (-) Transcript_13109:150-2459(-)
MAVAALPPRPASDRQADAAPTYKLLTVEEAEVELAKSQEQEEELEQELDRLYGLAAHLCQSESRNLAYMSEQHKQVPGAIRKLQETLLQTSGVADELSGRVRKLDLVCGRVSEALKLVDDMLELRECSDQVMKAIISENFEQAAKYVARYRASQDNLPPGTDDAATRVLREAEEKLSAIVRRRFDDAMTAKDNAAVSRFAKLFHPLGLAGEGVRKYVQFIRHSLADKCATEIRRLSNTFGKRTDAEPAPHAEVLTQVVLAIADIVQEHQQAVEEQFGPENFIVVLRGLVEESDVQGLRVIEKFLSDHTKVFAIARASTAQTSQPDLREVGTVLEETALITQRTQQFDGYIRNVAREVVELVVDKEAFVASMPKGHSPEDGLPQLSELLKKVQELGGTYVLVEQTYLQKSVELAVGSMDSLDPHDAEQLTTTMVDDSFFILQQSMLRATTTCDINAVCAVLNHVNATISGELQRALVSNLSESRRLYAPWISRVESLEAPAPGESALYPLFCLEGKLRPNLNAANSWPHSLNNLQQSLECLERLKAATEQAFNEYFRPPDDGSMDKERHMFMQCLAELDSSKGELDQLHISNCKAGLQMFKGPLLSPMLQPLDNLSYELGEEKYSDAQVNDPYAKAFIGKCQVIHRHLKLVLNTVSCDELMQQMADQTCKRIEKVALSKRFTLLGALQFETEVRALCSFFTGVCEQAVRHKFARLFDMAGLLTLEDINELQELHSELRTGRLLGEEMRKLLTSRVDFAVTQAELDMLLPG